VSTGKPNRWEPTARDIAEARRSLDESSLRDRDQAYYFMAGYVREALDNAAAGVTPDRSICRARAMLAALEDWKPAAGGSDV